MECTALVQYRNAVNSDVFAGFNPLLARVIDISSKSVCHQDIGWYYQATYQFEFKPAMGQFLGYSGYRRSVIIKECGRIANDE